MNHSNHDFGIKLTMWCIGLLNIVNPVTVKLPNSTSVFYALILQLINSNDWKHGI